MNQPSQLFHRPAEPGWLVLTGALPQFGEEAPLLIERLLSELDLSLPSVCLRMEPFPPMTLKSFKDDFEELIGTDLSMLDVEKYRLDDILEATSNAGFILLNGGGAQDWLDFLKAASTRALMDSFLQEGQVCMAAGAPAGALGTWVLKESGDRLVTGLGWLEGAIILPSESSPMEHPAVQDKLRQHDPYYSLGLQEGAVLALGPNDEVEVLGSVKPVISLGIGWRT